MIQHSFIRYAAVALVILALLASVAVIVPAETTASPDVENATSIEHELTNVDILAINWSGSTVSVTVHAHRPATVAITDSGAVDGLGSGDSQEIRFETFRVVPGDVRTLHFRVEGDPLVTIQEGDLMVASSGERSTLNIIRSATTVQLVQWSALSGVVGTLFATGASIGFLRRRHENTYRELTSGERQKIERDPVEGVIGRIARFIKTHRYLLAVLSILLVYLALVMFDVVPSPVEAWNRMTDTQRVITTGVVITFCLAFLPAFALVSRIWEPDTKFIFDFDAVDILRAQLGIEPENGGIAVYAGPPERVRDMEITDSDNDMGKSKAETPGGEGVVVRNFDAGENAAEGTWPGLADDREVIIEQGKIQSNREILWEEAKIGRELLKAMSAIEIAADTAAVRDIDAVVRDRMSVDSSTMDSILDDAAAGTRYEDYYKPDNENSELDAESEPPDDLDADQEVSNNE